MKPLVCVLKTDGTNCDEETAFAFSQAGATTEIIHMNELRTGTRKLKSFQVIAIPGGFSYGDDVGSGKILATEITSFLKDQFEEFISAKKPIIGICNGFQVLVKTGILPFSELGMQSTTLTNNDSGSFICRWVYLTVGESKSVFTKELAGKEIDLQIACGEGKFVANKTVLDRIENNNLVVFRYSNGGKENNSDYNPTGSMNDIAGICDETGLVLGLMPHPERFVQLKQHPNWRRNLEKTPYGQYFFNNAVEYVKNS